jgi:hypothetical protein
MKLTATLLPLLFSAALGFCSPPESRSPSSADAPAPVADAPPPAPDPVPASVPATAAITEPEDLPPALSRTWPARFAACEPYRADIARGVEKYLAVYPFPDLGAAQIYQESLCVAAAVSPVGAAGPAQFMPATWAETRARLNLPPGASPHDRIAFEAWAFYMAKMMAVWSSPRPAHERWRLGLASYNAGAGNIIAAQRACAGARDWRAIELCLPMVTGRHAAETRTYVPRIERWGREMGACAPFAAPRELQEEWGC